MMELSLALWMRWWLPVFDWGRRRPVVRGRSTSAAETTRSRPATRASAYQDQCSC